MKSINLRKSVEREFTDLGKRGVVDGGRTGGLGDVELRSARQVSWLFQPGLYSPFRSLQ